MTTNTNPISAQLSTGNNPLGSGGFSATSIGGINGGSFSSGGLEHWLELK